ncbi:MAG: hypothetical protein ABW321_22530 [Polyangiales bacterium]
MRDGVSRSVSPAWCGAKAAGRGALSVTGALALLVIASGCRGAIQSEPALPTPAPDGSPTAAGRGPRAITSDAGTTADAASVPSSDAETPSSNDPERDAGVVLEPLEPLPPAVYVAKVKSLLTGLVATEEEIARVERDPEALRGLITRWQALPEYATRMVDFFTTAFQQGDVTAPLINAATSFQQGEIDARVIANMRESFGRTAMQLVQEGKPFTEVLTTRRFMLTPALMVAMTWLEERQSGDGGGVDDALNRELGDDITWTMQGDQPIGIEESTDPASPNFLKFYSSQLAAESGDCHKPIVVDTHDNRLTLYTSTFGETLMSFFMGSSFGSGFCRYPARETVLTASDFDTWHMVTIRPPNDGEKRSWVYQIPRFRRGEELVYTKPHVGFYTTPAFLYTWQTNDSNQARVTANQTLIAAVGRRFDASLSVLPVSDAAVAKEHAKPGSACYGCHITMDPMRQYFRSTFTFYYGLQQDRSERDKPGIFAFDGQTHVGADITDLGRSLAASERFAIGWVHKLCTFANSAVCDASGSNLSEPRDPEFLRIVAGFRDGGYDWNALVQDLFSSPLVTYAAQTELTPSFPVAKKAHLCRLLDLRLGLRDVCGLRALPSTATGDPIKTIATVLPADSYSRGQTMPTLANDPGLFFYASAQNICATLAARVVDGDTPESKWRSTDTTAAVSGMVHTLMGLQPPGDSEVVALLNEHVVAARGEGASATDALRSAFMLACMSPSVVGVGQ